MRIGGVFVLFPGDRPVRVSRVTQRSWQGSSSQDVVVCGSRRWILRLDDARPGLHAAEGPADHILTLGGLAAVGRFDPDAVTGRSLVGSGTVAGSRVIARFTPSGWAGLQIRATWSLVPRLDGIDLEVEAQASSVDELKAVEVLVSTRLEGSGPSTREPQSLYVWPRDARSAASSYDGREPASELGRLTTSPIPLTMEPGFSRAVTYGRAAGNGRGYLEIAHPHDVARRIVEGEPVGPSAGGVSPCVTAFSATTWKRA